MTEWQEWHRGYDDPHSNLSRRLDAVRNQIGLALDRAGPGPITLLSLCAGAGLDVLPVLASHPRGGDVVGALVELDDGLADLARQAAPAGINVIPGDAGDPGVCESVVPVDLLLLCGIFGNIVDEQVEALIAAVPHLLNLGGTVLWTRHRGAPDLTPSIRAWFTAIGVSESAFMTGHPPAHWAVGAGVRTAAVPAAPLPDELFSFSIRPGQQHLG